MKKRLKVHRRNVLRLVLGVFVGTISKPPLLGGCPWTIPVGMCAIVGVIP